MTNRLLLVEFTTACGGGESLTIEGLAMTRALIHDARRGGFDVHVVIAGALEPDQIESAPGVTWHVVNEGISYLDVTRQIGAGMDLAFAVAPEFHGHLPSLTRVLETSGCRLLSQPSRAVDAASDKQRALERLAGVGITTPATQAFEEHVLDPAFPYPVVVKPNHGAGCIGVHVARTRDDLIQAGAVASTVPGSTSGVIVQQFIDGEPLSASAIAHDGGVAFLGLNTQDVQLTTAGKGTSTYQGGIAGISRGDAGERCAGIAATMQRVFNLSGYFGFDAILDSSGDVFVVEVNPRLTTPFIGHSRLATRSLLRSIVDNDWSEPLLEPGLSCSYSFTGGLVMTTGKGEEAVHLSRREMTTS